MGNQNSNYEDREDNFPIESSSYAGTSMSFIHSRKGKEQLPKFIADNFNSVDEVYIIIFIFFF